MQLDPTALQRTHAEHCPGRNRKLNAMTGPRTDFPLAEAAGIFVGIVAWDLLADGHLAIFKAALITIPCALVWFGVRRWRRGRGSNDPR